MKCQVQLLFSSLNPLLLIISECNLMIWAQFIRFESLWCARIIWDISAMGHRTRSIEWLSYYYCVVLLITSPSIVHLPPIVSVNYCDHNLLFLPSSIVFTTRLLFYCSLPSIYCSIVPRCALSTYPPRLCLSTTATITYCFYHQLLFSPPVYCSIVLYHPPIVLLFLLVLDVHCPPILLDCVCQLMS